MKVLSFGVIHLHLRCVLSGRIVGRQSRRDLIDVIRQLFPSLPFHDHMGARPLLCMKPHVISRCELKGQRFILDIILTYIDMVPVLRHKMQGLRGRFLSLSLLSACGTDVPAFLKLSPYLRKIRFILRNGQGMGHALQIGQRLPGSFDLLLKCRMGSFLLVVFIEIPLAVLSCRKGGVQRDPDLLSVIIVGAAKLLCPRLKSVPVGI